MPRMRTIKPEACSSETLAEVPRAVRWTFACLWTHCDDEGRAVWNPRLVKAAIYPLDDEVTLDVLRADVEELRRVGALCVYQVEGKEYLHVPAWGQHQHPNRKLESKLPPCPLTDHTRSAHAQRSEPHVTPHEHVTPVVVGEGHGIGAGETGRESATAQTIVSEWIERIHKRPPAQVIGQVAKLTAQMLAEGIDPDDVRRGIAAWMTKGLHPSTLPSVVNEVMNAPPARSSTERAVQAGMNLAAQLRAREQKEIPA